VAKEILKHHFFNLFYHWTNLVRRAFTDFLLEHIEYNLITHTLVDSGLSLKEDIQKG